MKDKQVYRNLETVTADALQVVKLNFLWTAEKAKVMNCQDSMHVICSSQGEECVVQLGFECNITLRYHTG